MQGAHGQLLEISMARKPHKLFSLLMLGMSAAIHPSDALCDPKPVIKIELSRLSVEEKWSGTAAASDHLKIEFVSQTNLMELSKTYSVGTDEFLVLRQIAAKRLVRGWSTNFEGLLRRKSGSSSISPKSNEISSLRETLWYRYSIQVPTKADTQQINTTDIYDMETDEYDLFLFVRAAQMKLFSGRIESNQLKIPKEEIKKVIVEYNAHKRAQQTPDDISVKALIAAIRSKDRPRFDELLQQRTGINHKSSAGEIPLLVALEQESTVDYALALISKGADVRRMNNAKVTPLMLAAGSNNTELLKKILAHKPDINAHNVNGTTALMYAASARRINNIELLLKAGADPNIRDTAGDTALGSARQQGIQEIVNLLAPVTLPQ